MVALQSRCQSLMRLQTSIALNRVTRGAFRL
jgi:hypothetical protein